jgi:hypothetical protein
VAGGDLHVAQVDPSVEHGSHERVPQHVRVHPRGLHAGGLGQAVQPSGRAVLVHPGAVSGAQDRRGLPVGDGSLDGAGHRRR